MLHPLPGPVEYGGLVTYCIGDSEKSDLPLGNQEREIEPALDPKATHTGDDAGFGKVNLAPGVVSKACLRALTKQKIPVASEP